MATVNLGLIKFRWQGAYAGGTAYVKDDVVSYNGSSYVCILASTGNLPTNTTYWNVMAQGGTDITSLAGLAQGDILYYNGTDWVRLGAGTSGQALLTQGTGANPIWGTSGKVLAVHFLSNNTRTSLSSAVNLTWLTVGSFTKTNASSDLYVQGVVPEVGTNADALGCWLQIGTNSDPGDNQDVHKGIVRNPTETSNHTGGTIYNMKFTGIGAGSQTVYVGQNNRDNSSDQPAVINPNNSDEGRLQQTASQFTIWEIAT
tara:strand:+ start:152 stop:925 length:774 start_codon:yes stop_codon:yes gene_type:complete